MEQIWAETPVDLMFLVSWRYMVSRETYERPRLGTYVFHDSVLPAYRGFAPTVWAMVNGESETGVTLFRIAEEVDAGPIADQERVPIPPTATIREVMDEVTEAYLRVLDRSFDAIAAGTIQLRPQNEALASFTCRRTAADGQIDWHKPTAEIYNLIRAVTTPYQGAFSYFLGQRLTVWSAERLVTTKPYAGRICGRVVKIIEGTGAVVLTGDGELLLREVQLDDAPIVTADRVLSRLSDTVGH
jgi:methionyl-tRNA formyltransferase